MLGRESQSKAINGHALSLFCVPVELDGARVKAGGAGSGVLFGSEGSDGIASGPSTDTWGILRFFIDLVEIFYFVYDGLVLLCISSPRFTLVSK